MRRGRSKKAQERREAQREGYTEFYEKHVRNARKVRLCENCGTRLRGHISEIAHILPKNLFKSVATNDDNVLYLGSGMFSNCSCHDDYDYSWSKAKEMPVWELAKKRFNLFKDEIQETRAFTILNHFYDN